MNDDDYQRDLAKKKAKEVEFVSMMQRAHEIGNRRVAGDPSLGDGGMTIRQKVFFGNVAAVAVQTPIDVIYDNGNFHPDAEAIGKIIAAAERLTIATLTSDFAK